MKAKEIYTGPRKHSNVPRVGIHININRSTFSTGDRIEGDVQINSLVDVSFSDLEILFLGTSRAAVERFVPVARAPGKEEGFHLFLKLIQPGLKDHYPRNKTFKAGQTYSFPFIFVTPQTLLPHSCRHPVDNDAVRTAHLQLPPSFGDYDLMRHLDLPDDLSPINASIRYGLYVRLFQSEACDGEITWSVVASKARRVRIVPSYPASDWSPSDDNEFCKRKERTIRNKSLAKSGSIVVEAGQPPPLSLPSLRSSRRESLPAATRMFLRFDPVDDKFPPPRLAKLASILKTHTYYASTKREQFPTKAMATDDLRVGAHDHGHVMARRDLTGVQWTKQHPLESATEEHGNIEPSKAYKGGTYYIAEILVPLNLPLQTTYCPSFHSCLLSRVYSLELCLGVHDGGVLSRAMHVEVPLQISSASEDVPDSPMYEERARQDSGFSIDEDDCAHLFSSCVDGRRHNSVIGYGNLGIRVEELPAYTR